MMGLPVSRECYDCRGDRPRASGARMRARGDSTRDSIFGTLERDRQAASADTDASLDHNSSRIVTWRMSAPLLSTVHAECPTRTAAGRRGLVKSDRRVSDAYKWPRTARGDSLLPEDLARVSDRRGPVVAQSWHLAHDMLESLAQVESEQQSRGIGCRCARKWNPALARRPQGLLRHLL